MHEVLVDCLGGLSLPRKSVVRLTDRPNMTLDVYRGHKTTMQQQQQAICMLVIMANKHIMQRKVKTHLYVGTEPQASEPRAIKQYVLFKFHL